MSRLSLHHHYDQLTPREKDFADRALKGIYDLRKEDLEAGENPPTLWGDDRCERVADAIAEWIIESRSEDEKAKAETERLTWDETGVTYNGRTFRPGWRVRFNERAGQIDFAVPAGTVGTIVDIDASDLRVRLEGLPGQRLIAFDLDGDDIRDDLRKMEVIG